LGAGLPGMGGGVYRLVMIPPGMFGWDDRSARM
jgi:hypothetical protein